LLSVLLYPPFEDLKPYGVQLLVNRGDGLMRWAKESGRED